jgi:hypothetical protein
MEQSISGLVFGNRKEFLNLKIDLPNFITIFLSIAGLQNNTVMSSCANVKPSFVDGTSFVKILVDG